MVRRTTRRYIRPRAGQRNKAGSGPSLPHRSRSPHGGFTMRERRPGMWQLSAVALLLVPDMAGVAARAQQPVQVDGVLDVDGPVGATRQQRSVSALRRIGGTVAVVRE